MTANVAAAFGLPTEVLPNLVIALTVFAELLIAVVAFIEVPDYVTRCAVAVAAMLLGVSGVAVSSLP